MFERLIAGMLGISVVLCAAGGPVGAQPSTPSISGSPAPAASPAVPSPQAANQTQGEALPPPPVPVVLPAVPNVAPGYAGPANPPLPTGELVGVNQPFVGINLQDAITMGLQRNTDLAVAESNNRIANYEIVAAKGAYDVQFMLEPQYQHGVQPAVTLFESGPNGGPITQISNGLAAAFSGQTTSGGRYSISGSSQSIRN
ncbi:MAG TPA: hypothetical protein VGP41_01215, partial [Candidatus Lustribacter sp.]|nr:hypothetical protein [Candidatus Lustribacter sp.]